MNKRNDAKEIYNLLLKQLKDKLGEEECKDSTLKIALEFIKAYDLQNDVVSSPKVTKIFDELPYI